MKIKVERLLEAVNDAITLRKTDKNKIQEYAERMKAGVVFPPVVIGQWPYSEKYGSNGIVDGLHRLGAAMLAEVDTLESVSKKFDTLEEALSYMYEANMAHGLPVTEGQRNARIKLLKQIDPKLTLDALAKQFKLGKSSIERILKGVQGEGKSGRKGGANASQSHGDVKPSTPKAILNSLKKIENTLSTAQGFADLVAYLCPQTDAGVEVDKEAVQEMQQAIDLLEKVLAEV